MLRDPLLDYRDVILITDGESHSPIHTNALSRMAERGVRLIVIGLGSDSIPAEIPVMNADRGKIEPLSYRNRIVHTRQDSKRLETIASLVPGSFYLNVGTKPLNMADIYRTFMESTPSFSSEQLTTERPVEQYWRFLLAAIACLAASTLPWVRGSAPLNLNSTVK